MTAENPWYASALRVHDSSHFLHQRQQDLACVVLLTHIACSHLLETSHGLEESVELLRAMLTCTHASENVIKSANNTRLPSRFGVMVIVLSMSGDQLHQRRYSADDLHC
jgi:hypothetical protein